MKVLRLLDAAETRAVFDLLNQAILRKLVLSEQSVTGLADELGTSTLKLWRRMQKLESLGLIEVSRTQRTGNLETKMYRATATHYVPREFVEFKPKDPSLKEAFSAYSGIQGRLNSMVASLNDIPEGVDPVDYSFYASLLSYASLWSEPAMQEKVKELKAALSGFKLPIRVRA
ncbi:MAG TPA: winged helix-turn-helix domain-containing protein [Nitrososphaerales archaeon]|nr:winged helix-turn-helix domain-containing protein [Nitrososphaerales archaeon]